MENPTNIHFLIKLKNPKIFLDFLNRFKNFDNNILLQLNRTKISARVFNIAKSVMKIGSINYDEIFDLTHIQTNQKQNQLPYIDFLNNEFHLIFYNFIKFLDILKIVLNISENDIYLKFEINLSDEMQDYKKENVYYINKLMILTKYVKILIPCGEKTLLDSIDDETLNRIFDVSEIKGSVKVNQDFINNLILFSNYDFYNFFKFKLINKNNKKIILFEGKNYQLLYPDIEDESKFKIFSNFQISIDKNYLKFLDKEDYEIYAKELKEENKAEKLDILIFKSLDSNFQLALSPIIIPEYENEE